MERLTVEETGKWLQGKWLARDDNTILNIQDGKIDVAGLIDFKGNYILKKGVLEEYDHDLILEGSHFLPVKIISIEKSYLLVEFRNIFCITWLAFVPIT